ncbi:hypothetical protein KKH27_05795 [bacterium]|nr:hypothetical protein [bacterium]
MEISKSDAYARAYRRILYVTFLEALSNSVPNFSFASLIEKFSDWNDSNRISLPELQKVLQELLKEKGSNAEEEVPKPSTWLETNSFKDRFEKLLEWVETEVHKTSQRKISEDPFFEDFVQYWPKDCSGNPVCFHYTSEKKLPKLGPERFKHSHLLYGERNALAHEFRSRFGDFDGPDEDEDEPVYCPTENLLTGQQTLELLYPEKFLYRLCDHTLCNVKCYFVKNEIDPIEIINSNSRSYLVR